MKKIKQLFSMALCLVMLLSLVGCSSTAKESDADGDTGSGSGKVYVPEYQEIDDEIGDVLVSGNMLYGTIWSYDEETMESSYQMARWDLNTMEKEDIPYDMGRGYVVRMSIAADGSLALLMNSYREESGNYEYELVTLDENSAVKSRIPMNDLISSYSTDPEWGVYPQYMTIDQEGNIYLYLSGSEDKLVVTDSEGNRLFDLSMDSWANGMTAGKDGTVYVLVHNYSENGGEYCLQAVDTEKKAWGESYTGIPEGTGSTNLAVEDETHVLVSSGDVLYRYDLTTQTAEQVLNWLDCDVNSNYIRSFGVVNDGRIVVLNYSYGSGGGYELVMLSAVDASEVTEKTVLTFGTLSLDYDIREEIIKFNKTNDSYRIEVKDYSTSSGSGYDYQAGINAFNADLAAGNVPDLIDLSSSSLNFSNYAGKGVFADLNTFLDNDSEISREDLMANPLKIYEVDGKQYAIPLTFGVFTLVGRTSVLHGKTGWTVQDVQEILAEQPEGTMFMANCTRDFMMYVMVAYQLDHYIDWANGTCSFDGQEFIDVLNFIGTFPSDDEMEYEGVYSQIQGGKVLVSEMSVDSVGWFQAILAMFDNDDVTCIGYPTADGSNGSLLIANTPLAISASSKNQEGAWEFIRMLLSEEYQDTLSWNFPIRQSSLDKMLAATMTEEYAGNGFAWNDFEYETVPATQEQIDMLRELFDIANGTSMSTDTAITDIISEEAAAFFSGQKTAEAVAEIIQSRVSIYVSENY